MAIVNYSGIISDMWGSIKGTTFSSAQGLPIAKGKPIPRDRVIPKRVYRRNRFSRAVWFWKTQLSAGNKINWINAAALFTQTRHGLSYAISGMNLYVAHRTLMEDIGQAPIAEPTTFDGRTAALAIAWAWNAGVGKIRGTYVAPGLGFTTAFWNTDGNRPGSTVRKTPLLNFQFVLGNLGLVDLDASYLPTPGTLFIHWITVQLTGGMSSTSDTYVEYP